MEKTSVKEKNRYIFRTKGLITQKILKVFLRKMPHCQRLTEELWKTFQFVTQILGEFIPKKKQLKSTDLPTRKHNQNLLIKQSNKNGQQIKQEPHEISVGTQMHQKEVSLLYFSIFFEEFLSKIKSFTGGHVSETEQKAIIIMKEGYTSQRRLL